MIENYTRKDEKDVLSIQTQKYKKLLKDLSKRKKVIIMIKNKNCLILHS